MELKEIVLLCNTHATLITYKKFDIFLNYVILILAKGKGVKQLKREIVYLLRVFSKSGNNMALYNNFIFNTHKEALTWLENTCECEERFEDLYYSGTYIPEQMSNQVGRGALVSREEMLKRANKVSDLMALQKEIRRKEDDRKTHN